MLKYERGQYRKKEKKITVCFCIYMVARWRIWSMYSKETFSHDAAHISDLYLYILAPVIFLKFPMKMK